MSSRRSATSTGASRVRSSRRPPKLRPRHPAGDQIGIVAQNIGSFKVKGGATTFPLVTGNSNDDFLVGLFGDLRVNEI
jgi:hypothetical protein